VRQSCSHARLLPVSLPRHRLHYFKNKPQSPPSKALPLISSHLPPCPRSPLPLLSHTLSATSTLFSFSLQLFFKTYLLLPPSQPPSPFSASFFPFFPQWYQEFCSLTFNWFRECAEQEDNALVQDSICRSSTHGVSLFIAQVTMTWPCHDRGGWLSAHRPSPLGNRHLCFDRNHKGVKRTVLR